MQQKPQAKQFQTRHWNYSYKTSSVGVDGNPVDILHEFYIPALQRAIQYDRVAGYFRSTSLAAASQGFSAFVESDGKMRLIVGADLDPHDVEAILQGDTLRLSQRLNHELEQPQTWPKDVQNGVNLLAWMVTHGFLEVKVAFRIHKETGKPLAVTSTEDGYVHEKWAIFKDSKGDRLYISGSLNESKTALILNAENIDVHADWWSEIERRRTDDAEADFESMWNDENPHIRLFSLPEAVKQRLIQLCEGIKQPLEIDGSSAAPRKIDPPSPLERLRFALIQMAPRMPNGRYVGLETTPIEPWPHQEIVARRLIQTWPNGYLLCDEVGLGKTIEAGLAIRSLHLSGFAKRILITPPAGLAKQWQREMATKFFLNFSRALSGTRIQHETIYPIEEKLESSSLYQPNLCIVSTGLLSRKERRSDLKNSAPFDIALVDEAHYARRKNPDTKDNLKSEPRYGKLYDTLQGVLQQQTRSLWLATATPMQLNWIEAFDLIYLTQRIGAFQHDPSLAHTYYGILTHLVNQQELHYQEWAILREAIQPLQRQDPALEDFIDKAVITGQYRSALEEWIQYDQIPPRADRPPMVKYIFAAAPLSRVMLRHTRSLLNIYQQKGELNANLAQRHICPIPKITFTTQEQMAYEELEQYCTDLTTQLSKNSQQTSKNQLGFYLSFLRLRFASSLYAIKATLRRRYNKVCYTLVHHADIPEPDFDLDDLDEFDEEGEEQEYGYQISNLFLRNRQPSDLEWEKERLLKMLDTLEDITGRPSKMEELLKTLDQRRLSGGRVKQTVIFTRFYDTLTDLLQRLRMIDRTLFIGTYSGQGGQYYDPITRAMKGVDRDIVKHRFIKGEIDILLCTDAAAEGLNLQTADMLINFDLPWNPMKVEQRIGRIDRIGQKYDKIYVLNLCYQGSAEEIVYGRLLTRLQQANYIVGAQQISLLPVTMEEFGDLAAHKLTSTELEQRAIERIIEQKKRTQSMEIAPNDLYDIYCRMRDMIAIEPSPITLNDIWRTLIDSIYLKDLGCVVSSDPKEPYITLHGIEELVPQTALTTHRGIYDSGLKENQIRLHFATYGDTVFESLLEHISQFGLPECAKVLVQTIPNLDVDILALAVVAFDSQGNKKPVLVHSMDELNHLSLAQDANIEEYDLSSLEDQLRQIVQQIANSHHEKELCRRENIRSALAQKCFNLVIMKSKLEGHIHLHEGQDMLFKEVIHDWEQALEHTKETSIPKVPLSPLCRIEGHLFWKIPLPAMEEVRSITIPTPLFQAALNQTCRIANSFHKKKGELMVSTVCKRLEAELAKVQEKYAQL